VAKKSNRRGGNSSPSEQQKNNAAAQAILILKDALIKEGDANRQQDRREDRWEKIISIATLFLVFCTTGGIIYQDIIIRNSDIAFQTSATAAKDAADVAKSTLIAGQRAWIKPNKISFGSPLIFNQGGASTAIAFEITNIGQSPASNVEPHAWLGVFKDGGPFPAEEQKRRCDEIRAGAIWGGHTIFPGETFPKNVALGMYSVGVNLTPDDIAKALLVSADHKKLSLFVVGCIDYTFATDPKRHHQTGFVLGLNKNGPYFISPDDGRVEIPDLELSAFGLGYGIQAD
jgi:hypothetical protein